MPNVSSKIPSKQKRAKQKRTEAEDVRIAGAVLGGGILGGSLGGPIGALIGGIIGLLLGDYANQSKGKEGR